MSEATETETPMAGTPVLFHTTPVPLFVDTKNPGSYYWANCIGVVLATLLLRLLIAVRPSLEKRFWNGSTWPSTEKRPGDSGSFVPLTDNDDDPRGEDARLELEETSEWSRQRRPNPARRHPRSWPAVAGQRISRAIFEVLIVGLGYLLMLAVMTMNIGYFLSVLAGVFLGTVILGSQTTSHR
ncbi:Ctr copper transporter family-domain-containing protein [Plectosphaerella plurivora]|uniref:Copper transport protein n=1 Tax=Plectosphaerella plurivora TaxID=936078 RepID=A0A9P9AAJ1_9PEZI|nr:Ctr copper transporter family-domain-containing protein [Plectosphaerella plurivora]